MNALQLLINDHKKVKKLLEEASDTTTRATKSREDLFSEIKAELLIHEKIEELIFYPKLKSNPKTKDLILEAFEEHHLIDHILEDMSKIPPNDQTWAAKLKVLTENVEHHVSEEEDNLFPKVKKILDKEELENIGEKMQKLKEEINKELSAATT